MWIQILLQLLRNNPILVCLALFMSYKFWQSKQPFPMIEGSKVESIKTEAEWDKALQAASEKNQYILVDFYATWCPPCRAAAEPYAKMSKEWTQVKFLKVNVDEAGAVAQRNAISAMPTFKLFKAGKEVAKQQGWSEAKVLEMLSKTQPKKASN
eukprot:g41691.t1